MWHICVFHHYCMFQILNCILFTNVNFSSPLVVRLTLEIVSAYSASWKPIRVQWSNTYCIVMFCVLH